MPTAEVNISNVSPAAPAVFLTVQRFCFDRSHAAVDLLSN